mgnify:FL=1
MALRSLRACGGLRVGDVVKELLWAFFMNGWVKEKLYPLYCRMLGREG